MMRVGIGLVASFVALAGIGCGRREAEAPPVPVKVGMVETQDVYQTWLYSGQIRPDIEVKLAFKQAGYVSSLHQVKEKGGRLRNVQVGDQVPSGTVLARLRSSEFEASLHSAAGQGQSANGQLDSSRAELEQAKAEQKKADLALERAEELYAAKAMTKPDYDSAVDQKAEAAAKVKSAERMIVAREGLLQAARGQVETAKIALSETALITPMPSLIVSKDVEPGSLVANGTTGFTIADTRIAKVEFGVPDSILPQFHMGAPVPVNVEGLQGREFTGRVTEISASANSDTHVFNIRVSIPNKDGALKVGMIASVKIEQTAGSRQLPMVPVAALITPLSGSSSYSVFVVTEKDGKQVAHLHSVRVGQTFGRSVVIEEGILPGDRIIVERTYQLADGSVVRPVN